MFEWLFGARNKVKYGIFAVIFIAGGLLGYYFSQSNNTEISQNLGGPTIIRQPKQNKEILIYEKREILDTRPNNLNRIQITGFIKNLNEDEQILYSFIDDPFERAKKGSYLIPTASLTKDNLIFLSGVGEKNHVILSLLSDNLVDRLPSKLHDANFLLLDNEKAVSIKDFNVISIFEKNKSTDIARLSLPENTFAFLEGFSEDRNIIYVSKKGNSNAELFKVNLTTRELYKYESPEGAKSDQMKLCLERGKGIFIKHALDPTETPYGKPIGPSSITLLDLESDTVVELFSSKNLFTDLYIACQGEKILVKENAPDSQTWKFFSMDGKKLRHNLLDSDEMLAFFENGRKVVVRNKIMRDPLLYSYAVKNLKNGEITQIGTDNEKIRYNVVGMILK